MSTLVINRNTVSVRLESDHIVIHSHEDDRRETMPVRDIDRVVVVGSPAITMPALVRFMDRGIPCVFMTHGGGIRGMIDDAPAGRVSRQMLQYDKFRDDAVRLELSRESIRSKLCNSRRAIQRLCSNRAISTSSLGMHWARLGSCIAALDAARDCATVRGIEGEGGFSYFRLLSGFFPEEFQFPGRSRRPPLDEANAVLSFAYSILTGEVEGALRAHSLDVGLGFMHCDREGSPSLALDMVEPFRPGFADMLAVDLFSHGRLSSSCFERNSENGGVYLAHGGRSKVVKACEEALERRFAASGGEHTTLRRAIEAQAISLAMHLEKGTPMRFFRLP